MIDLEPLGGLKLRTFELLPLFLYLSLMSHSLERYVSDNSLRVSLFFIVSFESDQPFTTVFWYLRS